MINILFRRTYDTEDEEQIAKVYFPIVNYRSEIAAGSLVIPRYSSLPFYKELETDITNCGSRLIQSYEQHKYIADFSYYKDIKDYTFESWLLGDYNIPDIPLVVKGKTNSKKWNWKQSMFAPNKIAAIKIATELSCDGLISSQEIVLRKYEELMPLEVGINGLVFAKEYRFFYLNNNCIGSGFYWSIADDSVVEENKNIPNEAIVLANTISKIVSKHTAFYVIDVAQKKNGDWICIELNCGTMSGLSCVDAHQFYGKLKTLLDE